LINALVVATQNGSTVQTATTDGDGRVSLANVPSGAITVSATSGITEAEQTLTVRAGQEFSVRLTLAPPSRPQLFVSSARSEAVLRYDGQTGVFRNVFAPPVGVLSSPAGLVFGPDNNLYVSSSNSSEILRYDGHTGVFLNTFVPAGSGGLQGPTGLVFGPDGNLYVSSSGSSSGITGAVLRYDGRTGAFLNAFV